MPCNKAHYPFFGTKKHNVLQRYSFFAYVANTNHSQATHLAQKRTKPEELMYVPYTTWMLQHYHPAYSPKCRQTANIHGHHPWPQ